MKNLITVDLGYGDSGKGTIVDYLTRKHSSFLTVRYSGGAQAFHTVYEGTKKHIFRQFGSGTLFGARTILGPDVVVNLMTLKNEAQDLERAMGIKNALQLITVSEDALIVTPYHRALNVIREHIRTARHGSTGMGIGEARRVSIEKPDLALRVKNMTAKRVDIEHWLLILRRELYITALNLLGNNQYPELKHELEFLRGSSGTLFQDVASAYIDVISKITVHSTKLIKQAIAQELYPVVFEAAQGVLLDQTAGFHPYTTWSDTSPLGAFKLISNEDFDNCEVIGITRTYATRHGLGPLVTEGLVDHKLVADDDNPPGTYQGSMRSGALDAYALAYAIKICAFRGCDVTQLAVTHCDKMTNHSVWPVCHSYSKDTFVPLSCYNCPEEAGEVAQRFTDELMKTKPVITEHETYKVLDILSDELQIPIAIKSYGKTAKDKLKLL